MTEENGTVYVLPYNKAGGKEMKPHEREEGSNDMVGYFGSDPGVPAIVPAGSVVVFSSLTFHRSGANRTDRPRRVFLAQYSAEPVLDREGKHLMAHAESLIREGRRMRRGAPE
jgi:ectoine hydroxylase-related dioxygenase (phytanoyl-CoA dioxygenase family)